MSLLLISAMIVLKLFCSLLHPHCDLSHLRSGGVVFDSVSQAGDYKTISSNIPTLGIKTVKRWGTIAPALPFLSRKFISHPQHWTYPVTQQSPNIRLRNGKRYRIPPCSASSGVVHAPTC